MNKLSIIKLYVIPFILILLILNFAEKNYASRHSYKYYYKKGLIQYNAEMYNYSIYNMKRSLELNPYNFKAANILAGIYKIKNKKLWAIDYYEISLKINNGQADIHYKIGELYELYYEKELAFNHFKKGVAIEPSHIKSNLSLSRYYLKKNDRRSADRHFNISYRFAKEKSKKVLLKAINAEKNGIFHKAIELYEQILVESPSIIEAYTALYEIYRKQNRYIKAAESIERLKLIKPDYEKAYIFLGHIYFTRRYPGKRKLFIDRAIKNLKKAIEINPNNYETYFTLSRIYDFIGDDIKARKIEKKAFLIEKRVEGGK